MIQVYNTDRKFIGIDSSCINAGTISTTSGITATTTTLGNGRFTVNYSGTCTSLYKHHPVLNKIPVEKIANVVKMTFTGNLAHLEFYLSRSDGSTVTDERFNVRSANTVSFYIKNYDLNTKYLGVKIYVASGYTYDVTITGRVEYNPVPDFDANGDYVLIPSAAQVHAELNGDWTATMTHPIDEDGRWKCLVEDNIVKMPSFNGDQLFRIKQTEKEDSGINCEMEPIFYDAAGDCWLSDVRPTKKNGQEALNLMLAANKKYSASSNISTTATSYFQFKNFLEALNGDDSNSFINRWGGEIYFDNYKVIVNEQIGEDNGVTLLYGKNTKEDGLTEEVETRDIVTRIYPKAYNGHTMTSNGYVDSPLLSSYATIHAATITFSDVKMAEDASDEEDEGTIICNNQTELDAALTQRCNDQYNAGLDKPTVSISADMVLLQNTVEYADYKELENVGLGDTIHCKHSKLGIVTDARVIELDYDSVKNCVDAVVLGDFQYNTMKNTASAVSRLSSVINEDGTVVAEKVAGFINASKASMKAQYNASTKTHVLALLFENLDKTSDMYGAMGIGTQGIMISKTRNEDDTAWSWTTAITANGMVADTIVTGIISDKTGKTYWDLDAGKFVCENGEFSGKITASTGTIGGFKITSTALYNGKTSLNSNVKGTYISTTGISTGSGTAYTMLSNGYLSGGTSTSITGYVGFNQAYNNVAGTRVAGKGHISLLTDGVIGVGKYYSNTTDSVITTGQTGSFAALTDVKWTRKEIVTDVDVTSSGNLKLTYWDVSLPTGFTKTTIYFSKGLMTTEL